MQLSVSNFQNPLLKKTTRVEEGYLNITKELSKDEFMQILKYLDFEPEPTPLMSSCTYFGEGQTHYHIDLDDEPLCSIIGPYMLNEHGWFGLLSQQKLYETLEGLLEGIEPELEEITQLARWETIVVWEDES